MSGLLQSCANYIFSWWSHTVSETFPFNPRSPRVSSPRDFNPNSEEDINAFLRYQFALRFAECLLAWATTEQQPEAVTVPEVPEQSPDNESRAEPNQDLDRAQTPERN